MTREQKIQNILKATGEVIRKEGENGTMTPDKFEVIMICQNTAILAIID